MQNTASCFFRKGIFTFPHFEPALAAFSSRDYDAAKDIPFFLKSLGLDERSFFTVKQVHGDRIFRASSQEKNDTPEADAVITNERSFTLIIRTADCLPVFFLDPLNRAIGLAHAGWRGVQKQILKKTLEAMIRDYDSDPSKLQIAFGPCIRRCCYEVGNEFFEYFPGSVQKKGGRNYFDLAGEAFHQLEEAGVPKGAVTDCGLCTACSTDRFFSARREGPHTGRLLSGLMLK